MKKSLKRNRILSLFIISAVLPLSTYTASATVADGVYAYEKGDYQQARTEWLPYAAMGNANALYNLGQLYRMGRGVKKNYVKAREYYLRAAEKGHIGAQRNLGTLYYFGRAGKVDHKQAFIWLTKAAINGDPRSQFMVGIMHFNGEAGQKNNIQAYAWVLLAAKNGLGKAKLALTKLQDIMTADQIARAKKLAPRLISHQLTPDDIGLMVKRPDATAPKGPKLNNSGRNKQPAIEPAESRKIPPAKPVAAISPPAAATTTADNFRVQLGSYRTKAIAQRALKTAKVKLGDIIGGYQGNIVSADLGKRGIFYRLQLSPFKTRHAANEFCSQLKTKGQNCYSVTAR
ncbi:MAG: hypothetical protein GXP02_02685 [Alphaproteobacteria bacterium]|nr:hypothetical protein [Alphaproteobacteria bacterium]